MSDTTRPKILAYRITSNDADDNQKRAWFAAFWDEGALRFGVRKQPEKAGDAPRWRWETVPAAEASNNLYVKAAIRGALRVRLDDVENIAMQGAWEVEITEHDAEGMSKQGGKPTGVETKSLTERLSRVFDTVAPRISGVSYLDGVAEYLLKEDGPLPTLQAGGDLEKWTKDPLSAMGMPVTAATVTGTDLIKLADGSYHKPFEIRPGLTDVDFMTIAFENKIPVVLFGEPGVGKTHTISAALERHGLFSETLGSDTMYSDLVGGWLPDGKGGFYWIDRVIPKAMKARNGRGAPCFLDEITQGNPTMLVSALYDVMVKGYLTLPGNPTHPDLEPIIPPNGYEGYKEDCAKAEPAITPMSEEEWIEQLPKAIFAGPDFYICAAGNPDVVGAQMSEALLDRLTLKPTYLTNYDAVLDLLGTDFEDIVTVARHMENLRRNGEVSWAPQFRALTNFAKTTRVLGGDIALANLLAECRLDSDREILQDIIGRSMGITNIKPFTI